MNKSKSGLNSRRRGYAFERHLTDQINDTTGWRAWRLGAPQMTLPDILAVGGNLVVAIECKSTKAGQYVRVPYHQIELCRRVAWSFPKYHAVAAIACRVRRKTFLYMVPDHVSHDMICDADGRTFVLATRKRVPIQCEPLEI